MKILSKYIIIVIMLLFVISQIILLKTNNTSQNDMIAKYVFNDTLSNEYIIIKTSFPSNNVFVLENGEKIDTLDKKEQSINIANNTVIEIDGQNEKNPFYVEITKLSNNIDGKYYRKIKICSNIAVLGRFFIK